MITETSRGIPQCPVTCEDPGQVQEEPHRMFFAARTAFPFETIEVEPGSIPVQQHRHGPGDRGIFPRQYTGLREGGFQRPGLVRCDTRRSDRHAQLGQPGPERWFAARGQVLAPVLHQCLQHRCEGVLVRRPVNPFALQPGGLNHPGFLHGLQFLVCTGKGNPRPPCKVGG
jgi:hypothetical protein